MANAVRVSSPPNVRSRPSGMSQAQSAPTRLSEGSVAPLPSRHTQGTPPDESPEPSRPAPLISARRPSRPKAPWPLDTLITAAHNAGRVFTNRDERGADEKRTNANNNHPSIVQNRTRTAQAAAAAAALSTATPTPISSAQSSRLVSNAAIIDVQASKLGPASSSPDFADLPVTPPDAGNSSFAMPSVADLTQPPFVPRGPSSAKSTPYDDFHFPKRSLPSPAPAPAPAPTSAPPRSSRNDIFSAPSPKIVPAPKLGPVSKTQSAGPSPSKNSLFFSRAQALTPPPSARPSSALRNEATPGSTSTSPESSPSGSTARAASPARRHAKKPSLGRASTEEREREQARIRQAKDVEFRLSPTKEFLLGEGRHCNVYLGSYWVKPKPSEQDSASEQAPNSDRPDWKLCAIKRLHADRHSQLLGLDEAFALRRLGPHPNVVRLIDIRDEVEFTPSPLPSPRAEMSELGKGLPSSIAGSQDGNGLGASHHGRSTSEMTGTVEVLSGAAVHKQALEADKRIKEAAERGIEVGEAPTGAGAGVTAGPGNRHSSLAVQSQSLRIDGRNANRAEIPTFRVAGPDGEDVRDAEAVLYRAPVRSNSSTTADPPRLLILLELLPYSLASYVQQNPNSVDLAQWHAWAVQMAEAVAWLHSRGCIHSDIKKENMLLTPELTIKLCDFNSAVFPNPSDPPTDGVGLGTPAYGAPELSRGAGEPFSFPIDVYSLGVVLYSLATGEEPFSQARSVVEMMHRKRAFFESEENVRASRAAVSPTLTPSRSSSLRSGHGHGRGRGRAEPPIERLLAPTLDPCGLLVRPTVPVSALERTASLGHAHRTTPPLRRTSSYGDPAALSTATATATAPTAAATATATQPKPEAPTHPYDDGIPALLLPGGGRLPDAARNLLRHMTAADPARRPTAAQVLDRLRALQMYS